ncbi:phage tail fiber protein [Caballeronia sp. DA-9]|uniref:phage tail fiber protein n=1 Tax=Caballeronia sp. DA-9 TaxID=3436237 RepID=UPI003F6765AA
MNDFHVHHLSGGNLSASLRSSLTFPDVLRLRHFSDDCDALAEDIGPHTVNVQGILIGEFVQFTRRKSLGVFVAVHVPPGSEEQKNLQVLAQVNRAAPLSNDAPRLIVRAANKDLIELHARYGRGQEVAFSEGALIQAGCSRVDCAYLFHFASVSLLGCLKQ